MPLQNLLNRIERAGNRLPSPTLLFIYLTAAVLLLSAGAHWLSLVAVHPVNGATIPAINLLSRDGLARILTSSVGNFTQFAPVGTVLTAVLGIAVAEHSGLLSAALRATVLKAPAQLLTFSVVLCGILSSIAQDTGYVILLPLAAIIFLASGRHPVVGIAAAFAGVSGGYSANLLLTPLDPLLAGISTEAARLVAPAYSVNAAANYYFMVASTLIIAAAGTWVTHSLVAPRFPKYGAGASQAEAEMDHTLTTAEIRGLNGTLIFTAAFAALLALGLVPEEGVLRNRDNGSILQSPFMSGIVVVVAVYAALAGIVFGRVSGRYRRWGECVEGMEQHMATMAGYLVLMFFAAQFVNYFAWSNLGTIIAIKGAALLQTLSLPVAVTLVAFVLLTALINLFIGSASAKWALLAPVFVPMLLLAGLSPEAAQVAYRIGDSSTNIITPLMPYFGVVVAFAQKYQKDIGVGSLVAMMLPYSVVFLLVWSCLLAIWVLLGWPLGPGATIFPSVPVAP
jgi:Putative p-aminobenzoyl-glutamate transporter